LVTVSKLRADLLCIPQSAHCLGRRYVILRKGDMMTILLAKRISGSWSAP
jgi:hypothetical protein